MGKRKAKSIVQELLASIAGLFLVYGIDVEGYAGKRIISLIKQIEKIVQEKNV